MGIERAQNFKWDSKWSMQFLVPSPRMNVEQSRTLHHPQFIHLLGQNGLMAPFLSSQGSVLAKDQISLYLNLCPDQIFSRSFSRLNGSGCRVITSEKISQLCLIYKGNIFSCFLVDSSLTSLILLCNFNVNSLCLWTIWHPALSPSTIDVKVQELFASHWCIVEICNLAWLYLFWPMNDI